MSKKITLDEKDLQIVNALFQYGYQTSTRTLSKKLKIPYRTISYRLKRLRDNGYLYSYPLFQERYLGLGDCNLVIQESPHFNSTKLAQLLEEIPYFYFIASTYGRYNGILCYAIYSLTTPSVIKDFLSKLKEKGMIEDFHYLNIMGQKMTSLDLTKYDPKTNQWNYDWNAWFKQISRNTKRQNDEVPVLEIDSKIINFDLGDLQILKGLKRIYHFDNTKKMLRELGATIQLSDTQVRRRLRRLENEGVIKGYLSNFEIMEASKMIFIYIFMEMTNPNDSLTVWSLFNELPFQVNFYYGSKTRLCAFYRTDTESLLKVMEGLDLMKKLFCRFFIQLVPFYYNPRHHFFTAYNWETNCWETPIDKYIELID
ncbi:MAG: winged helix-turn-helix transcriptional regulator [Candidatus Hodarchaeota archaeon]